jgi:hypothetical protein
MPTSNNTLAIACRSCGAYGNSQHRPTCQPGRSFKLCPMRRAARDSRTSAAVVAQRFVERSMLRSFGL